MSLRLTKQRREWQEKFLMGKCGDCEHWRKAPECNRESNKFGICRAIPTDGDDNNALAVISYSDSKLLPTKEFGCVLFKQRQGAIKSYKWSCSEDDE